MTIALIQPLLSRGFHEITTGQWTWQEVASSFISGNFYKGSFYSLQMADEKTLATSAAVGIFWLGIDAYCRLESRSRNIVWLGSLAWLGTVAIPDKLSVTIDELKKLSPQVILIAQIGIIVMQIFNNPKQMILELAWTTIVFIIPQGPSKLSCCFHHFVYIPMTVVATYHSGWLFRCLYIHVLFSKTLAYHPEIQERIKSSILEKNHPYAMVVGLIPFDFKKFSTGLFKNHPGLPAVLEDMANDISKISPKPGEALKKMIKELKKPVAK